MVLLKNLFKDTYITQSVVEYQLTSTIFSVKIYMLSQGLNLTSKYKISIFFAYFFNESKIIDLEQCLVA